MLISAPPRPLVSARGLWHHAKMLPLRLNVVLLLSLLSCREEGNPKYSVDADNDGVRSDVDCDDADSGVGEALEWYSDLDGDGFGGGDPTVTCTPNDGDVSEAGDCDDADPAVSPAATEECDGLDQDCDGVIDNGFEVAAWYTDADADGYGDDTSEVLTCDPPAGAVSSGGDCDDLDADFHPGAAESDCTDPADYNCDGSSAYDDADADGTPACQDCDDSDANRNPGVAEQCDGIDQDCDGEVDEDSVDPSTWYADYDEDGYGDPGAPVSSCVAPDHFVGEATDCDDGDSTIHPGAEERCDGVDEDCDGVIDNDPVDAAIWYVDADGDTYGDDLGTVSACEAPAGYAEFGGDCDDADAAYNPGAVESDCVDPNDYNCDGSVGYTDGDGDGYAACEECDDGAATIFPGATEACNGSDDDCDGEIDEADAVDSSVWYADADGDGYGDAAVQSVACVAPDAYVADSSDCDDAEGEVHPGRTEFCNGLDDDCDGETDEGDSADASGWYTDADGDGVGAGVAVSACEAPAGTVSGGDDCDDLEASAYPGATEICDGLDNNCDGAIDESGSAVEWYADADGDGYGDASTGVIECEAPPGSVPNADDCDDAEALANPGAAEGCDGLDNNCDGEIDESGSTAAWYLDLDGDGYGDPSTAVLACEAPTATVSNADDCDDTDAAISPAEVELCDSLDNNCDLLVDEGFDQDGDGLADCYDTEECDGIDNDGDGEIDEAGAVGERTWYADLDGDGAGDAGSASLACDAPSSSVENADDCDDTDAAVSPLATERCDGIDNNCDGQTDDAGAVGETAWYVDDDGDGYGDAALSSLACEAPAGAVATADDCDDGDSAVSPAATEACDGVDNNCDGVVDGPGSAGESTWYADLDGDGYGDASSTSLACTAPSGSVGNADDCDDTDAAVSPAATEVCNDVDDDCDGETDNDAADGSWYYTDDDCDGEGDPLTAALLCDTPVDGVTTDTDCDDTDARSNSLGVELCDSADNDCDGTVDESCVTPTSILAPSGPPVDLPAETGACATFAELTGAPDPHSSANLASYMRGLEGTAYTRNSTVDMDADRLDWSIRCGSARTASPGNFSPTNPWPALSPTGTAGAGRFRGYIHLGCGDELNYTLGLIGNDALTLTIEGATIMTVNWSDGRWQKFRYVSFPEPGIYEFEVQWSTNFNCGIDPFELVWAEGFLAGYNNYDTMCASAACAYATGVPIPGFSVIDGDHLLESSTGANTACEWCTTTADCSAGLCNDAGICE